MRFSRASPAAPGRLSPERELGRSPMPPVCSQRFLPLVNYLCPWPEGRSIMQEREAWRPGGALLPAPPLPPAPGRGSPQPSGSGAVWRWPLNPTVLRPPGWDTYPGRGPFHNCLTSSAWRGLLGHPHKGPVCPWAARGHRNSCHRTRVQETAEFRKVPSSRSSSQA